MSYKTIKHALRAKADDWGTYHNIAHFNSRRDSLRRVGVDGIGKGVEVFEVTSDYKDYGVEIHTLTDKGFVVVSNMDKGINVTVLAPRPAQMEEYMDAIDESVYRNKTAVDERGKFMSLARDNVFYNYNRVWN